MRLDSMTKLQEIATRRELFVNLTLRELRGKYKRSVLGWAWSLLNPLATMLLYSFVFGFILKIEPETGEPSGLKSFPLYLLCGLLPFNFLALSLTGGMGSLIGNSNLIKKTYFPREILVGANTASWLVSFLIEMGLLTIALLVAGNGVLMWLPAVVVLIGLQTMFVLGLALALAAAAVYFRDLEHLLGLVLQAWFYSAPIVYPMTLVTDRLSEGSLWLTLYNLNPLTRFVSAYRDFLYSLRWPPADDLVYLVGVSVTVLIVGYAIFGRLEGRLAEEL
jgi:ABC-type polysaccharide/polyol phosphate export permease